MSKPQRLPSGSWRIRYLDHLGSRRSAVFLTESAARAGLRRAEVDRDNIRAGLTRPRSAQTLKDAASTRLDSRPPRRKLDNQSHLDNHILPALGALTLAQISPDEIERFIRRLEGKRTARKGEKNAEGRVLSAATIANVLITLRKLMNDCGHSVRIRYRVPTSGYGWIRNPAEVGRFLDECGDGWFRMACELAVYAGLRKGEVAALRRDALDFDRRLILVDRSYDGPTKSRQKRYAPMSPQLATRLRAWLLRHPGPLLVTVDGQPMTERTETSSRARRACKRAGVPEATFHQLRHTFASHLAQRVSLPIVGAMLGHANPMTTARYAHLDTESLARSERVHLDFTAPSGDVVPLPVHGPAV